MEHYKQKLKEGEAWVRWFRPRPLQRAWKGNHILRETNQLFKEYVTLSYWVHSLKKFDP